jgi:hypothetical protein
MERGIARLEKKSDVAYATKDPLAWMQGSGLCKIKTHTSSSSAAVIPKEEKST